MARTPELELVSHPGTKVLLPEPAGFGFPTGHAVTAVAALLAGLGWTLMAMGEDGAGQDQRPEIAANVLRLSLAHEKESLLAQVRVMADDARTRTTLATEEIDRATVEDVMQDLLQAGHLSGIAVFDARGKAVALVGRRELAEIDLAGSRLATTVPSSSAKLVGRGGARIWALEGDALVVATAPVMLGSASWTLLAAKQVQKDVVDEIRRAVGTSIGIAIDGQLLIAASEKEGDVAALQAAVQAPIGRTNAGGHSLFSEALEQGPRSPLVVAASDRSGGGSRSQALLWFPMVLLAVSAIANVLIALRR